MNISASPSLGAPTWSARLAPFHKYFLLAPMGLLLTLFFASPLLWLGRVSFQRNPTAAAGQAAAFDGSWTLDNYLKFFGDDYYIAVLGFTLQLAAVVTVCAMVLAYPMAYFIYRSRPRLKVLLLVLVLLPKFSNILVLVYGVQILLSNSGPVNEFLLWAGFIGEPLELVYTFFSVVMGEVLLIAPYTVLVITAAMHGLDATLRDAAEGLGASPTQAFWTVTFPLTLPGTFVALLITVVWALGAFVSPVLLGSPEMTTLAVEVPKQTFENINWPMGATIAFIILGMMTLIVFAYNVAMANLLPGLRQGRT